MVGAEGMKQVFVSSVVGNSRRYVQKISNDNCRYRRKYMLGEYKCLRLLPSSVPSFSLSFSRSALSISHGEHNTPSKRVSCTLSKAFNAHSLLLLAPYSVQRQQQHQCSARYLEAQQCRLLYYQFIT